MTVPTIGRIVHYVMSQWTADAINNRRKSQFSVEHHKEAPIAHVQATRGNAIEVGRKYPAMIVAVWGELPTSCVNLQVFLDGNDQEWVTSLSVGKSPGCYEWPQAPKSAPARPVAEIIAAEIEAARPSESTLANDYGKLPEAPQVYQVRPKSNSTFA